MTKYELMTAKIEALRVDAGHKIEKAQALSAASNIYLDEAGDMISEAEEIYVARGALTLEEAAAEE